MSELSRASRGPLGPRAQRLGLAPGMAYGAGPEPGRHDCRRHLGRVGTGGQISGQLPVTGSDSSLLLQIALILIVIGGLLALAARKRRHAYE